MSAEIKLSNSSETEPEDLTLSKDIQRVVISFPNFLDGRGFTLARLLRLREYSSALRTNRPIISDQYAMARTSGFDELAILQAQAVRQPEYDWLFGQIGQPTAINRACEQAARKLIQNPLNMLSTVNKI